MGVDMMQKKNPAGQGQGYETGRGGDPNNRKGNVANIDNFVKHCHALARLLNPLFMPVCCNMSASLASPFLPNWFTQQKGQK
jgi:hypothetical protein